MATTTVLTPTTYILEAFDYIRARNGALCVAISGNYTIPEPPTISDADSDFCGAGIVRKDNSNRLVLVHKGISYYFKDDGDSFITENDHPAYVLKLATIAAPTAVGPAVEDIVAYSITRSTDGTIDPQQIVTHQNSVVVSDLNPRDEFAIQALQSMMEKIPDPAVLSDAEMDLYCKAAYLWASNMMKSAANARATTFIDEGAPAAGEATISSLDNNTERLLNNLIQEFVRSDRASNNGTWSKKNEDNVPGEHTNIVAQTLPKEEGTYQTVAEAEADGWSWKADYYSKITDATVQFKDVTMSGIQALIEQLRGKNGNTFYNESLYEHYLRGIIDNYLAGANNTKVKFKDLIDAANLSTLNKAVDTTLNNEMLKIGIKEMPNSLTVSNSGSVNIGSSGLGSYSSPIYVEILGDSGSGSNTGRGLIFSSTNYGVFQNPQKGYYYKVSGSLSSVAITLPAASSTNNQAINIIVFNISCLPSAPFSITPTGSDTISYKSANPGYTLSGEYEIECTDVGDGWIIDVTIIV